MSKKIATDMVTIVKKKEKKTRKMKINSRKAHVKIRSGGIHRYILILYLMAQKKKKCLSVPQNKISSIIFN